MQGRVSLLNGAPDCSVPFYEPANTFFHLERLVAFDSETRQGSLLWRRHGLKTRMSFNQMSMPYETVSAWEFPDEYGQDKILDFDISFIGLNTLRLRMSAGRPLPPRDEESEMLMPFEESVWQCQEKDGIICYSNQFGQLRIQKEPFALEFLDSSEKLVTRLVLAGNQQGLVNDRPVPTSVARRADDLKRMMSVTLTAEPGEHFAGGGESFTRLDKKGQKLHMWACDPKGVMGPEMYKPVPFYMSSSGYGLFLHSSAPSTFDFGSSYDGAVNLFVDDDMADLFFFFGTPQLILDAYTRLTGKSPLPPVWSFGLWMSRCTYQNQEEVAAVAENMRRNKIPCDVIHLDTGWFETNWRCDFQFSPSRFPKPKQLFDSLRRQGYHASLWVMPYFNPNNPLYPMLLEKGYAVRGADGGLPTEDAVLDFSNPEAVEWFQGVLKNLLKMGASAIKTDFGEAGPLNGLYASGQTGRKEHNLYPLRYQKAVFEASQDVQGQGLIWARGGFAGSQRYPVHWGGDAESTNNGMAASLRGGLSLGASGFAYWSHDVGGFGKNCPEELYLRWLAFGAFSSHFRCHGQMPKEPWMLSENGMKVFRKIVETRYQLLPYLYTQATMAALDGLPLMRGYFIASPEDPLCWTIEDAYLLGSRMLVAPLFTESRTRSVYLPEGNWVDYFTGTLYQGRRMYEMEASELPIIVLVRCRTAIPHAPLVQSTNELDWEKVYFRCYPEEEPANGVVVMPDDSVRVYEGGKILNEDPQL